MGAIIARIGVGGGIDHVIEFAGSAVRAMSMEQRMTICNMSIEAGAQTGFVAPDETTFAYLDGRQDAPKGAQWEKALAYWRTLPSDPDAVFDAEHRFAAAEIAPTVSWGTSPEQASLVHRRQRAGSPPRSPIPKSGRRSRRRSTIWGSPPAWR